MRPIILADFVRIEGVKPLLAAQLYDKRGDYQTSVVCPCDDPVLAVQIALEMAEFAGYYGIIDFQTSDRGLFAVAMAEPDLNTTILHPSDTAHLRRIVADGIDAYRDFYPEEVPKPPEEEKAELTGWRAKVVRFLQYLISKLDNTGECKNEEI
ncbi:hypothetical protein MJ257_17075 [Paenibacillus timonensis]|uniref:Uncharacterized protein n=1 Tax=Paenibacillus timonensis TaxID=225915 RepID=A0ABW3SFD4_9BACL|nr:hypothetical protein [Paenibacillus timonensis]MCH1641810.1 hypothetical protein [Paenibacillus timonensis]